MLRSFRVANHKSFRDETELLLLPAYDKSRPVVPVVAIFGANASGKSNLVDALHWLQRAVRESYARWETGSGVPRTPFRLDPDAAAQPSLYCVELLLDGLRYTYGVEVNDDRVISEWLYTYPRNRRRVLFAREQDRIRLGSTVPDYRSHGERLKRQTRNNALFLSVAAQNDLAEAQPAYEWFRTAVAFPDGAAVAGDELLRRLADERQRSVIVELISAADLGISDVTNDEDAERVARLLTTVRLPPGSGKTLVALLGDPDRPLMGLRFHHAGGRVPLTFDEQSAGTRSWVDLVSTTLDAMSVGQVMVVDEIDASLHPHLTARLIDLFRDRETNPAGAQLLFTTHDATLLDEDTLARDGVWFLEKDPDSGASCLYPLTDFHPRKNEDREGRYLAGSYGAVPVLSDYRFRRALGSGGSTDAAA